MFSYQYYQASLSQDKILNELELCAIAQLDWMKKSESNRQIIVFMNKLN